MDEAELARERGEPLLGALAERFPDASERGEIAARLAGQLAAETEVADPALVAEAARLQEVGKLYVPVELLRRPPGELLVSERERIAAHPEHGRSLARGAGVPERACTWMLHSRERWDGTGPTGLTGEEIPLPSRIIAVTREYLDAPALAEAGVDPRAAALIRLEDLSGSVLDPDVSARARRLAAF